jgi:hypothetical protein
VMQSITKHAITFSSAQFLLLGISGSLILTAYLCMAFDPSPYGFGILTLNIAPIFLLVGLFIPILPILGKSKDEYILILRDQIGKRENLIGVLVFFTALITYTITLEPTASLWDCGEFIASAYKLQVPHTPGTPLTLIFGRVFTMLSFGDVTKAAWCMNFMSAFFSALSVLLVYVIILRFVKNHIENRLIKVLAAVVGALCLTFSDTFWFSAVEAETYGIASFFLLLILLLMIRIQDLNENEKGRHLILIFYLSALAYCIHPMCVLVLAALPFVWFGGNASIKMVLLSVFAGLFIVFAINKFVAIGLFNLAFQLDVVFVNTFGLPFYTGAIALTIALALIFTFLLKRFRNYSTYSWSAIFLLLGFLPYLMLFIRSNHNPPIDETNPEDLAMIKAYMNRESYPSSPVVTGPYFDAQITDVEVESKAYYKSNDRYQVAGNLINYKFDRSRTTILPRMYSRDPDHIQQYKSWAGLRPNEKPDFIDNISFMLKYQIGHMYLRYLMWNFVGREGDVQNSGWLKPWDRLAHDTDSKARNQYWMIPLLLGIVGACFQYFHDRKNFYVNLIFFLITGLILAVYLNSPPVEPRERDYIYVASYIAFSIWIGLGIISIYHHLTTNKLATLICVLLTIAVPGWMFYQNVDDHNRAGRTFQMDHARALLNSCAHNAILFTGGDNDTFPMWYLQEVEGFRTDVRIVVLSYFNTDWYINQLKNQYYESKPIKLGLTEKDYRQYGLNDVLYLEEKIKGPIDAAQYMKLIKEESPVIRRPASHGDAYHILPSRSLAIPVNTTEANASSEELVLNVTDNFLQKNALAAIDVIINNFHERPIYFNFTSMNTLGLEIQPYVQSEGMVYRLTARRTEGESVAVNKKAMYENLIQKTDYSNLKNEDVFFNHEDFHLRIIVPLRQSFNTLAEEYLSEADVDSARVVLNHAFENLHHDHLAPAFTDIFTADLLRTVGERDKAFHIARHYFDRNIDDLRLVAEERRPVDRTELFILDKCAELLSVMGDTSYQNELQKIQVVLAQASRN